MPARVRNHIRTNVVGYVALFCFAIGGTALAVTKAPRNSVVSKSIRDGGVKAKDVKPDQLQLRVGESCPAGEAIRAVNVDGGVLCEVDDTGSGAPSGPAGGGLAGTYPNPSLAANSVGTSRLQDNAVTGPKVAANTLTGDEVSESTLGQVPSALLGGFGRKQGTSGCDPEGLTLVACASVTLNLPQPARVLLIGSVQATPETGQTEGHGRCRVGTSEGLDSSVRDVAVAQVGGDRSESLTIAHVTPTSVGPGSIAFRVECSENTVAGGAIRYFSPAEITAVALAAN